MTIRYEQIKQLEVRKLSALKTTTAVGGGLVAAVVLSLAIVAFQSGLGIKDD